MSIHYEFKRLDTKHLTELMSIERSAFDNPWSAQVMRDSLLAAHTQTWGLIDLKTEELIGYAVLSVMLDEAELLSMTIKPDRQGQGFGRKLLKFVIEKAKSSKAETLFLEVRATHPVAIHLYKDLGFTQIGIRKNYYLNPNRNSWDDAILMSLKL